MKIKSIVVIFLIGTFCSKAAHKNIPRFGFDREFLYNPSLASNDTNQVTQIKHGIGLQYLGTANNVMPFYSFELKWPTKYSILAQIGFGVDPNWRPPSFELVIKILNNYYFFPRFALNYGFGIEQRFNPWYMADPTSYNFVENCQFGWCPDGARVYFIDIGLQIGLTKNLKWFLTPKYNYNLKNLL